MQIVEIWWLLHPCAQFVPTSQQSTHNKYRQMVCAVNIMNFSTSIFGFWLWGGPSQREFVRFGGTIWCYLHMNWIWCIKRVLCVIVGFAVEPWAWMTEIQRVWHTITISPLSFMLHNVRLFNNKHTHTHTHTYSNTLSSGCYYITLPTRIHIIFFFVFAFYYIYKFHLAAQLTNPHHKLETWKRYSSRSYLDGLV